MRSFRTFFFWLHFSLYVIQQLNMPDSLIAVAKGMIGGLYIVCILLLLVEYKVRLRKFDLVFLGFLFFFVALKLLFLFSVNIALIYWGLCFFCISKMGWEFGDFIKTLNQSAVVYFVLAILFTFSPLKVFFSYEIRDLENRFFPSINRFIGLEGSPAGPDIFYTLVFVVNLYKRGILALLGNVPFLVSIVVLLWTASLSNLVALLLAGIVFLFYRFRFLSVFVLLNFFLISNFIIEKYGTEAELILNGITTLRANIWMQVGHNLSEDNRFVEWCIGRSELIEFISVGGEKVLDANPHNLGLFAFQFFGVPLYLLFVLVISWYVSRVPKGVSFFILAFMLSYSITNVMPFTTRGNPVIIYLFILCLLDHVKYENRILNSVSSKARDD